MGHSIINEKIVFLLPINQQTKTCGIFGHCPDNIRNKLESIGLEVSSILFADVMQYVQGVKCDKELFDTCKIARKKLDILLFFDIPTSSSERESLLAHVKSICSDSWLFAVLLDTKNAYGTNYFVRILRSFDAFMFVRRGRSFLRSLGAANVDTLTIVPGYESPGVVLDNRDTRPITFMRVQFFNFLRANNPISKILLHFLIVTGCINYFIGKPMIVGKK